MICLVFALVPVGTGGSARLPVPPGSVVRLPSPGLFSTDEVVLYGRSGDERPGDRALGCSVTDPDGNDMGRKVYTFIMAALGPGDRTVGNEKLVALAEVTKYEGGWLFRCTGPAARTAQPLYLLSDNRRIVPPLVVAPFGLMCLALGAGALLLARQSSARR